MNVPLYSWQTLAQWTWLYILCLLDLQMVFRGSPMEPTSQVLCIHRQGIPQCVCLDGRAGLFKMHTLNTTMFETDCTGSQSMQRVCASPFALNIIANMWYHNVSFTSIQRGYKMGLLCLKFVSSQLLIKLDIAYTRLHIQTLVTHTCKHHLTVILLFLQRLWLK